MTAHDQTTHRRHAPSEGARRRTGGRLGRVLGPWAASLMAHAGLALLAFLVTWTVVAQRDEPPAPVIVADFDAMTFEPLARLAAPVSRPAPAESPPPPAAVDVPPVPSAPAPPAAAAQVAAPPPVTVPVAGATAVPAVPVPTRLGAEFVGIRSSNARRIVYVIDASGSMLRTLPIVLDELRRSIERLDPTQSFALFFFQEDRAVGVEGARGLMTAHPAEIDRQLAWVEESVIPGGRSNPLAALRAAIELDPDVVFLLSENITGAGVFEIDADELLERLDTLNPRDAASGRRAVTINCIQFLDPDPLRTLERIAEAHGGPGGYTFLDRASLGLTVP